MSGWSPFGKVILGMFGLGGSGCSHVSGLCVRCVLTAGPDVVRLIRSLSGYRAATAQDITTGSPVHAVHSAVLSHHTMVTPPTVLPRGANACAFVYAYAGTGTLLLGMKSGW